MKRRVITLLTVLLLCLAMLVSCGAESNGSSAPSADAEGGSAELPSSGSALEERKIIREYYCTFETLTFDKTVNELQAAAEAVGGYVHTSRIQPAGSGRDTGYASLTLMVPSEKQEEFGDTLTGMGKLREYRVTTQDVSLSYADTEARIASLQAEQERVMALYSRTDDIATLMKISARLEEISAELTSYQSQLAVLENRTAMATFYISIYDVQEYSEEDSEGFFARFGRSFAKSFSSFGGVVQSILIALVYLLPYLLTAGVILTVILTALFLTKKKKRAQTPDAAKKQGQTQVPRDGTQKTQSVSDETTKDE